MRREGAKAGPALRVAADALLEEDASIRRAAVQALGSMTTDATLALRLLGEALFDADSGVGHEAVTALGKKGPAAKAAVPELIGALSEASGANAADIAWVLGRMGADAKDAVPALIRVVEKDRYVNVRGEAIRALGRIGPAAKDAVPAIVARLTDFPGGRRHAIKALVVLGRQAPEAVVPALAAALAKPHRGSNEHDDEGNHLGALAVLVQLGQQGKAAVPVLSALLADRKAHPFLRVAAAEALWRVDGQTKVAVEALVKVLRESTWSHGWGSQTPHGRAAEVLDRMGPAAKQALPELEKLLKSADRHEQHAAAGALWSVGGPATAEAVLPVLITLLEAKDLRPPANWVSRSRHRPEVLQKLGRMGPAAKKAVPLILRVMKEEEDAKGGIHATWIYKDEEDREPDERTEVRRAGLAALQRIDPEGVKKAEKKP
jgi:HEAT repeat protein